MENSFIPKAIDTVKDAIAADTAQEYEIALGLYKKSLEYFMTGLKYEPNPVSARSDCERFCAVSALSGICCGTANITFCLRNTFNCQLLQY